MENKAKILSMTRFLMLIMVMTFGLSTAAQTYQAYRIYELNGPVKEVKIKTEDPFLMMSKEAKFVENGMQKLAGWTYDEKGLVFGEGFCGGGTFWNAVIVYDNQLRPEKILRSMNGNKGSVINMTTRFVYDASGNTERKEVTYADSETKYVFEYSDYTFDSKGNWITRNVTQIASDSEGASTPKAYTEVRTIKY